MLPTIAGARALFRPSNPGKMSAMRRLQLLYAFFCTIWALYAVQKLTSFRIPQTPEHLRGVVFCTLLIAVLPIVPGYLLFFRAFPWINRLVRR